jgi:hypothetical protein
MGDAPICLSVVRKVRFESIVFLPASFAGSRFCYLLIRFRCVGLRSLSLLLLLTIMKLLRSLVV